jgi:pimeloyl-ACP methyl ester carboxylesterase
VLEKLYQPIRRFKKLSLSNEIYKNLYISIRTGNYHSSLPKNDDYINVWYFNKFKNAKTILYFHGNSYNISYRKYMVDICNILQLNLLLVDYRGYGKSSGNPSAKNVLRDAQVSYSFLRNYCEPKNIIVWGESLGSTPACWVASKNPEICGLILLSPFSSLHSLLSNPPTPVHSPLYSLARLVTKDIDYYTDNLRMARKIKCHTLIYHSVQDKLIDFKNSTDLLQEIPHCDKRLIPIKGGHETPQFTSKNFEHILDMITLNWTQEELEKILKIIQEISYISHEQSTSC